ncbi:hypothetical protein SAMN05421772_11117 [Paracoccus saliphilus]|nr:hypothetical protein SAMN05421772_11117 [Paracoccus saliphilus]
MLVDRSVDQVAADLRMDSADIEDIATSTTVVMLRCNDTGHEWRTTGWRGAYRRVCLLGLTDWDWWPAGRGVT